MLISISALVLILITANERTNASVIGKKSNSREPWRNLEPFKNPHSLEPSRKLEARSDDEIVTVTAKIWYVSDFHGKYTSATYEKVDESCEDNPTTNEWCDRVITSHVQTETIPEDIRNSWDEDTPHNRAQAVVSANLDYMNEALANSEIPIRYVQWGSVQDIGQTEQQIGSGYTGPGGPGATRETYDVYDSVKVAFGDSEAGRTRLYQSADVVLLLLNNGMKDASGVCNSYLHAPEGTQKEYRFAVFVASYWNGWLFSHEAGHCIGGMHLKPSSYTGTRTNFAYCPPDGEYGTIEAYVWNCANGPSGVSRGKVPYWSNPNVMFEGVATGSEDENNAGSMTEWRFDSAAAGTNCLDGNPDEAWMNGEESGTIGNNCPNGESSYELPLSESLVNCEYADWAEWGECDQACGGGSQSRTREVTRHAWYGGIKCTEDDSKEEKTCNEAACPVCDDPKELDATAFSCEDSGGFGTPCTNTYDGDESTVWTSGLNSPDYTDPRIYRDGKYQWGLNTNVKIILSKETIVSGVQIINKVDEADYHENYKAVELQFSNGYAKEIELANGKQNEITSLENPVETSFVTIFGLSTWGQMPDDSWLSNHHTGFRSGLSEIRVYGCEEGLPDTGVDGGWSEWGEWTECSAECGPGTKSRSRTCTSPEPSGTGLTCSGENSESESCQDSACEGDVCFDVTITTTQWGEENSWVLGTCSNTIIHENYQTHEAECCLPPGEYTLECKDSYGDGWHGGFITINETNYCENFNSSSLETHEVLIGSDTEPEEVDEEWIIGHHCPGGWIETFFRGALGKDLETAKSECAGACNARDDCKFADLFGWGSSAEPSDVSNWQTCYLRSDQCGDYQDTEHWAYRVYIKP